MRVIPRTAALVILTLTAQSALAQSRQTAQPAADSTAYWAFVDALAEAWAPLTLGGGYDARKAGSWDVPKLTSLLSSRGVDFEDPNDHRAWHSSFRQLQSALRTRRGPSAAMLLHLGFIRAQPYSQYSALTITQRGDTISVLVGNMYEIWSMREGAALKVVSIKYLQLEDF